MKILLAIIGIAASILLAADRWTLAQAGSAGGAVGRANKSISGSESQPAPQRRPTPAAKPVSLAGTWQWRADCSDGTHWEASFIAAANGSGAYAVTFVGAGGGSGLGTVSGNAVTLSRAFSIFHQTWTATLSGARRMTGSVRSPEGGFCSFQASR